MDSVRVRMIHDFALNRHWPFARLVRELKESGVALLRLNLVNGDREFLDSQGSSCFEEAHHRAGVPVAPGLDEGRISLEFGHFLYSNTSLTDLLAVLAGLGVQFFEVDLEKGCCSFHGHAHHLPGLALFPPGGSAEAVLPGERPSRERASGGPGTRESEPGL